MHRAILYISLPSLHHYDRKLPNFTSPLYGVGEYNTKIFFFSCSKLRYGPFGFNPETFRQHLTKWMKLNKANEVWNSANQLFKWRFGLLSSRNFATMATWCNDFSSLLITSWSGKKGQILVVNQLTFSSCLNCLFLACKQRLNLKKA